MNWSDTKDLAFYVASVSINIDCSVDFSRLGQSKTPVLSLERLP
jgi:hypothetical protein